MQPPPRRPGRSLPTRHRLAIRQPVRHGGPAMPSPLDTHHTLDTIVEQSTQLLHATHGALSFYDPKANRVRITAVYNLPPRYKGVLLEPGEGVTGRVIKSGQPLIINGYYPCQTSDLD